MIFKETVPLPDGALPDGSLQLTAPLALSGLLDGAAPVQSALDLTGRATPLFSLSGTAVLYVRTLVSHAALALGLPPWAVRPDAWASHRAPAWAARPPPTSRRAYAHPQSSSPASLAETRW